MGAFFTMLLSSEGLKRKIASVIAFLLGLTMTVPALSFAIPVLTALAGLFGGVGAIQAVSVGSVSKAKIATISSVLSLLLLVATYVPALKPYVHVLQQLAAMLGAAGTGALAAPSKATKK